MTNSSNAKLKTLCLLRILQEETDAEHGLSMPELIERLAELGISAERKAVYRDLAILREFGCDIQTFQRSPVEYAIVRRDFSLDELMLLIDAVQSCKALTKRTANALTTNLKLLASDNQRAQLERRIHVAGRIKSKSEGVFEKIDMIHQAIHARRKVTFKYYHRGVDGKRRASHDNKPYEVTPVAISYDDGFYYLTAFNDEADRMFEFRIDRMGGVAVSEEKATSNDLITNYRFDDDEYAYFGRFGGRSVTTTLEVDASKVEIIFDRFGDAAEIIPVDEHTAHAIVKVHASPVFFGWIASLENKVRIAKPEGLLEEYRAYLRGLIEG